MLKKGKFLLLGLIGFTLLSWAPLDLDKKASFKCMVQLTNYYGEGAYMVVSLLDPDGNYDQTLYVMGQDEEWYPDLSEWWSFFKDKRKKVDGISGATVAGGERTMFVIKLDQDKIDAGYTLRFETAVEDKNYHADDVEIPLTTESTTGKFEGKGYIRYVRLAPS